MSLINHSVRRRFDGFRGNGSGGEWENGWNEKENGLERESLLF